MITKTPSKKRTNETWTQFVNSKQGKKFMADEAEKDMLKLQKRGMFR